ncbi:MAG: M6 family metalloprotease domain-containing protein [Bacteroidales bacterium]|nr:M6 family metalloprotease domain-containing protein [Bacteroidales bacterium]
MKKNILLAAAALLLSISTFAGPAYPGRIVRTQPDGTTIGIYLHGDEWHHWMTDDQGNIVREDEDGYIRVVNLTAAQKLTMEQKGTERRAKAMATFKAAAASSKNFGSPKIPVLLVGFKDQAFTKTAAEFDAMLNTPGYSDNNAVGSVLDFYRDNSFGEFTPEFEVLGPVNLDNNMSYYGGNDSNGDDKLPEMALIHAAQKLDASVDFSQYDNDGDGTVDFVLFYFAGCDEAQGASSNAIWSHAWYLSSSTNAYNSRTFDGVKLNRYFCTAELKGSSVSDGVMCSIGTTCHEFAHTLGLPDFYDADYSTNGSAANMYDFDLMANGSYNNNSTTPPYFTAEELWEIGWLSNIPELSSTGSVTMQAINYPGAKTYTAYKIPTSVTDEYLVLEVRGGTGWDAALPGGLLAYHVDRSSSYVSRWSANTVNNYSAHPCCYIVQPSNPTATSLYSGTMNKLVFGGTYKAFTPTAWGGNDTGYQLKNITYSNGVVTFDVTNSNEKGICGTITDTDKNPLSGVTVSIYATSSSSISEKGGLSDLMRITTVRKKAEGAPVATAVTDAGGNYSITLPDGGTYLVRAERQGYVAQEKSTEVGRIVTMDFTLLREGEELPSELVTFPENADFGNYGSTSYDSWDMLVSNIYPASYLSAYTGKQIKSVSFMAGGTSIDNFTLVVDYGDTRALALSMEQPNLDEWVTVDVTEHELIIPDGKDVFVGYGGNISGNYPIWAAVTEDSELVGYMADFDASDLETVAWDIWEGKVFAIKITVGDYVKPDTGYNFIADPKNGSYSAGDLFELNLIETTGDRKPTSAIEWLLDDEPVSGTSVTLTAGSHVIEARFTTTAGNKEVVELELAVN